MIDMSDALLGAACLALVGGVASLAFQLAVLPGASRPRLGNRGLKRVRALRTGSMFALFEPLIRYIAARLSQLPLGPLRVRLDLMLMRSGDHLGLSDDELMAMSVLSGSCLGAITLLLTEWLDLSTPIAALAFVLGAIAPSAKLAVLVKHRAKRVTRSLPGVIELAAMCMGAGLDFPGSLRRIVDSAADPSEPIIEELRRLLQELDLGHTRRVAMMAFSNRVPTAEVRELVNSVVQAEEKGSPLSRVLTIQAQTLRLRRSVSAEEMASEAALMLVGPMALIFLCVITLLLGPVAVRAMSGAMGAV